MIYWNWWQKNNFIQKTCHKVACYGHAHTVHLPLDKTSTLLPAKKMMEEALKIPMSGGTDIVLCGG